MDMGTKNLLKEIREAQAEKSQAEKELEILIGQKQGVLEPVNQWIRTCNQIKKNIETEIGNCLLTLKRYKEEYSENELEAEITSFEERIEDFENLKKNTNDNNKKRQYKNIVSFYEKKVINLRIDYARLKEVSAINSQIYSIYDTLNKVKLIKLYLIYNQYNNTIEQQIEKLNDSITNLSEKYKLISDSLQGIIEEFENNKDISEVSKKIPNYSSDIKKRVSTVKDTIDKLNFPNMPGIDSASISIITNLIDSIKQEESNFSKQINENTIGYGKYKLNKFSSNVKSYIWIKIIFNALLAVIVLCSAIWALPKCHLAKILLDCCGELKCSNCIIYITQAILFLFFMLFELHPINKLCKVGKLNLLANSYISDLKVTVDFATTHDQIKEIFNDKYDDLIEEVNEIDKLFK